jgi:hypothetical protein
MASRCATIFASASPSSAAAQAATSESSLASNHRGAGRVECFLVTRSASYLLVLLRDLGLLSARLFRFVRCNR